MANKFNSAHLTEFCSAKSALVWLRIIAPFFLIYNHGWGKLMKVIAGNFQFMDPIGIGATASLILATFAEAICAFLVLMGFYTRGASLILVIHFIVVIFLVHMGQALSHFELPVIYVFIYLTFFLTGPGKFSVDDMINGDVAAGRNY